MTQQAQSKWLRRCKAVTLLSLCWMIWATTGFAQSAGAARVHIISFGLWGAQSVFQSEASGAARILAQRFGPPVSTVVKANTKRSAAATEQSLSAALAAVSKRIDAANDVLMVVLTSHGSPDGIMVETQGKVRLIPPETLRRQLALSQARYKIIIVSACYSGIFMPLADADTLVITAASATRSSFGCKDGNRWTYFGEAFFAQALRNTGSLTAAFELARDIVARREIAENFTPSNPQISGGQAVLERLGK